MEISKEEKEMIITALQAYINSPYTHISYEDLRKYSDLKERLRSEIRLDVTE